MEILDFSILRALAVGLLLVLLVRLVYARLLPKPIPNVPHNPITSVWGDIPDITQFTAGGKKTFGEYVADFVGKHGPISQILVGNHPIVVVADRLEAERVLLRGKNTDQSKRTNEIFATVIPTGQIALPANDTWKRHRRLTGPSMSRRYLERMSCRISAGATNLVRLWSQKIGLVGPMAFDADMDLQLATMDTIVNITMGISPGCIDTAYTSLPTPSPMARLSQIPHPASPPLHSALRTMMESIERASQAALPWLTARLFVWPSPKWRSAYSTLSAFINREIAHARMRENEVKGEGLATDADCVVDMIVQREAREGAEKFGKDEMLDELLTYIIAGQDTTAAALAWLIKFLPLDLDIQQRLHHEVSAVLGPDSDSDRPLDFEALDNPNRVPVLEAVVAETLRCAGVGSLSGRELTDDEVISGRHIPKGTQLMFPISFMSKQESDWGSDAKVWRPSRWLRPDGSFDRAAGPNIPFGLGQRSCFGQRLAILQLKIFTAALSRAFIFKQVPAEVDSWEAVELVTKQPKNCFASLERWPVSEPEV
ncbi:cytochrome P450 family protein [Ceratobasidium sp. AG-Ba]|nr:cytochrome P450 family protein [Ceratobasidium sp. AG-Ba]